MKKLMFLAVSAALAVVSFAATTTKQIASKSKVASSLVQQHQEQSLILEHFSAESELLAKHYSHRSHSSHSSHRSHSSHYSSR